MGPGVKDQWLYWTSQSTTQQRRQAVVKELENYSILMRSVTHAFRYQDTLYFLKSDIHSVYVLILSFLIASNGLYEYTDISFLLSVVTKIVQ